MYDYGLTSEAFWNLTPAQFYSLSKSLEEDELQQDFRFGIVATLIANANRNPKKRSKPFDWTDFFPRWKHLIKAKAQLTPQELLKKWESIIVPKVNALAGADK